MVNTKNRIIRPYDPIFVSTFLQIYHEQKIILIVRLLKKQTRNHMSQTHNHVLCHQNHNNKDKII